LKTEVSFELSGRELCEGNEPGRSKWLASAMVILLTFALCHLTWRVTEMQPRPRLLQQEEKILFPLRAEACDFAWVRVRLVSGTVVASTESWQLQRFRCLHKCADTPGAAVCCRGSFASGRTWYRLEDVKPD